MNRKGRIQRNHQALMIGAAALTLTTTLFASPSRADEQVEVSMNDLRAMDPSIDSQLEAAGYTNDANDLSMSVSVTQNEDDHSPNFDFYIHKKRRTLYVPSTGLIRSDIDKNVFSVGFVMSKVYYYGGAQVTWGRYNPYKGKIAFHVDAAASWAPEIHNFTLSFDPHIGRSGAFVGVNAQLLGIKPAALTTSPTVLVPAAGIEAGWRKAYGPISVGGKIGLSGTNYHFQNYWWLNPSISVQWNLNGRSNHKISRRPKSIDP